MKKFLIIECDEGFLIQEDDCTKSHLVSKRWCYLKLEDALNRIKKLFDGDDGLNRDD